MLYVVVYVVYLLELLFQCIVHYGPLNTHISVLGVQPVFPPDAAIIPDEGKVSVSLMRADVHLQGQAGQQGEDKEQQESHPDSSLVLMW